mgnify:CR=1 FL=1|jgi:hypothetical protein
MEIAKEQLSRNHRDEVRHRAHMEMTPLGNAVGLINPFLPGQETLISTPRDLIRSCQNGKG